MHRLRGLREIVADYAERARHSAHLVQALVLTLDFFQLTLDIAVILGLDLDLFGDAGIFDAGTETLQRHQGRVRHRRSTQQVAGTLFVADVFAEAL